MLLATPPTTHFSIGWGTKLALEDAAGLVDALQTHPELSVALAAFESRRRPEVEQAQHHAVHSLQWFENFSRDNELTMPDFTDLLERRPAGNGQRIGGSGWVTESASDSVLRATRTR